MFTIILIVAILCNFFEDIFYLINKAMSYDLPYDEEDENYD